MEINKIEIGDSCFGDIVRVNDIDLINELPDNNAAEIESQALQNEVLKLLFESRHNLSASVWKDILIIVAQNLKTKSNHYVFEESEQDGYTESCEQCGNYNYLTVYNKTI